MTDPFLARTLAALTGPSSYARTFDAAPALDLGVGEVRYPIPDDVNAEITTALGRLTAIWYSHPAGEPELRRAFLRSRFTDDTAAAHVDRVLVTSGGKEAAWLAVRYLLHRCGHPAVLTPSPGWEPYTLWSQAAGCRTIAYDPAALAADPAILCDIVAAAPIRPGLLVVNYPHNPTGVDIDQDAMDTLVATAAELRLDLVCDEVYRAFARWPTSAMLAPAYDPRRHLVVDSCSKWLTTAGLRVGFLHADAATIAALTRFRATYASCTSPVTQAAALALLTNPVATAWLRQVRAAVIADRDAVAHALTDRGVDVASVGGLYVWCRRPIPGTLSAVDAAAARVTPGDGFGAPDHIRVCPARAGLDPAAAADAVVANLQGD
jgi:aspartate/methionine/tyrosine aminotransferase